AGSWVYRLVATPFPQPGRSEWTVGGSTVYLEVYGDGRRFILIEPVAELAAQGARPRDVLFAGRKIKETYSYEGRLRLFAGNCGTSEFDAAGPISNDDLTVTLIGMEPRIDPNTCL